MSYKLLVQIMDYESNKNNFTVKEQKTIEKKFKDAYSKLGSPNRIGAQIIRLIDDINNG